jgi:hypothetical protein
MYDNTLPFLVSKTETHSVLCEVRAEAEERVDDVNKNIKLFRYLSILEISIIIYCTYVVKFQINVKFC